MSQKKHLVCGRFINISHVIYYFLDKMIANENLRGIPLLVLANKQDIPECMGVREVKPIFNKNAHLIGKRDCMVMPISALTG
jgi:ADP-ribosylation factor related protein 1